MAEITLKRKGLFNMIGSSILIITGSVLTIRAIFVDKIITLKPNETPSEFIIRKEKIKSRRVPGILMILIGIIWASTETKISVVNN